MSAVWFLNLPPYATPSAPPPAPTTWQCLHAPLSALRHIIFLSFFSAFLFSSFFCIRKSPGKISSLVSVKRLVLMRKVAGEWTGVTERVQEGSSISLCGSLRSVTAKVATHFLEICKQCFSWERKGDWETETGITHSCVCVCVWVSLLL